MAACTGNGTMAPACLRTAARSAMSAGSPARNPARYEARFDVFDSEWMAISPVVSPSHTRGSRIETGSASQAKPR